MYQEELKVVSELLLKLDNIIEAQNTATKSPASLVADVIAPKTSHAAAPTPIKLNKPEAIIFSGNSRDFSNFKRDFMAIIVPSRSAADIGLYLKQAIPNKHLHLVANVAIENHSEMMDILAAEF